MSKLEDKRVKDNDFEQYEECVTCKKGFWATSEFELGDWHSECFSCREKREKEERSAEAKLKKEVELHGEKIFSENKLIGRMYKSNFYFDDKFSFKNHKSESGIDIDEEIRRFKKAGKKTLYWNVNDYFLINSFADANGFQVEHKDGGFIFGFSLP